MSGQPVHMQRAEAVLREARSHLDLWIEVADARAPRASRLPRLRRMLSQVDGLLVLTHLDQADPTAVGEWCRVLEQPCFAVNAREALPHGLRRAVMERMRRPPLRLFVAGLPNVGKSTLLNRIAGARAARVGARAGVTRAEQWIQRGDLALLDLPGILPRRVGPVAAALGYLPDGSYDVEEAARFALRRLPAAEQRYGFLLEDEDALGAIAQRQHLLRRGGVADRERAARLVLRDLRDGRIIPAQLEWPDDAP